MIPEQKVKLIFKQEYHGFEDLYDVERDVHEAFDEDFNPAMKGIPGEFSGTMKIVITYEEAER
jgi:hypothetical protein